MWNLTAKNQTFCWEIFLPNLIKIWLSVWHHYLASFIFQNLWNEKRYFKIVKSILIQTTCSCFKMTWILGMMRYFFVVPLQGSYGNFIIYLCNRPHSIYQYSKYMALRLSGINCKFFELLLSLNSQNPQIPEFLDLWSKDCSSIKIVSFLLLC